MVRVEIVIITIEERLLTFLVVRLCLSVWFPKVGLMVVLLV